MNALFAWHNLIFYLPILFGILLVFGSALGFVGDGADIELDADVEGEMDTEIEADADGEAGAEVEAEADGETATIPHEHSVGTSLLDLLGVGRVPLSLLLMMASFLFGGVGLSAKYLFGSWLPTPWIVVVLSIVVASAAGLFLTGLCARGLSRILPSTETNAPTHRDLIGRWGVVELAVSSSFGLANVRDDAGGLIKIRCCTDDGLIQKGARVLITDYDLDKSVYVVARNPM